LERRTRPRASAGPVDAVARRARNDKAISSRHIARWRKETGLSYVTTNKILKNLEVFDSYRIREIIRNTVEKRTDIFRDRGFYITSFGSYGKSGGVVFYDFRHATDFEDRIIEPWEVSQLPPKSTVIYVDDLIGTGSQSVNYIHEKVNRILPPSCDPYLFSICATPRGIKHSSNFKVICGLELDESEYNHYLESNPVFSKMEKEQMRNLNERLNTNLFDMGLLLAFYYSAPDNTMPFLWKEGFGYRDENEQKKSWFALLPRRHKNSA